MSYPIILVQKGAKVVSEGPHVTLLPEEAMDHCGYLINGKTRDAYHPKQMTSEELFEGYMWFRKEFYSWKSIIKRTRVSRVNFLHNLFVNLGCKLSIRGTYIEK